MFQNVTFAAPLHIRGWKVRGQYQERENGEIGFWL